MVTLSYMRSVVGRNVVMRRITAFSSHNCCPPLCWNLLGERARWHPLYIQICGLSTSGLTARSLMEWTSYNKTLDLHSAKNSRYPVIQDIRRELLKFSYFIFYYYTYTLIPIVLFLFCGAAAQRGPWPPHFWGFLITHSDAPQSVGLLWTSDQLVAETSTLQHITLTTDKHPCLRWDSNPRSQLARGRRPTP